ncbi:unnamed protein product, partial [Laminaria digitata]
MAFLGLKMHGGRDFHDVCWSVNLSKDQGALPDGGLRETFIDLTGEEQWEASFLLGFDVELRRPPHGVQYIK